MSETPRTDGRVCKCLDLSSDNACDEYVDLCRTLETELAAMTRERDKDYAGMRDMQSKYIQASQERDELRRKSEIVQAQCDKMTRIAAKLTAENNELGGGLRVWRRETTYYV